MDKHPKLYNEQGEHRATRELYNRVTNWDSGELPFSKDFRWDRWGLLGILGDYVLNYTRGDIVEIGMCESSIFFTKLSSKYNRIVYHCDIQQSIIENCKTIPGYFGEKNVIFLGSSDDFFKTHNFKNIALGFIDGDHTYEQVSNDFYNLLPRMVDNGFIFLHDTYPPEEDWLGPTACGTVYKLRQEIEKKDDLDVFTFTKSAINVGLTMVRKKPSNLKYFQR